MLKKVVDFKKISPELRDKLKDEFPDGFEEKDIIKFKNMQGEEVKAIRLEDAENEIVYLVKIEKKLSVINDEFLEEEDVEPEISDIEGDWDDDEEEDVEDVEDDAGFDEEEDDDI